MNSIKKILFPTDFSETAQNAFRYCLRVADHYEASIELLHVVYPEYQTMDIPIMAMKATNDKIEAARLVMQTFVDHALMQVQVAEALQHVPVVHPEVLIGDPINIIADTAKRNHIDLIVMGTKGEHNVLEKTFGSVTTGVLARAHCHVWIVPEKAPYDHINVIGYATDLNEADAYHIWKAMQVLEPFHPILHCIHVSAEHIDDEAAKMAELELFFTQNAPALQINFHQIKSKAIADALADFAATYDLDTLVMYAPQHTFFEKIFHQSQTKKMAFKTDIPILFYKS